jgi:hypothetical protein
MIVQFRPIGFIATGTQWRPGLYVRFLRWHFSFKRTRDELFSERHGHVLTFRLAGLSLTHRRIPNPA